MEIGTNEDIDFIDEIDEEQKENEQKQDTEPNNTSEPEKKDSENPDNTDTPDHENETEDDFLTSLLKSRGIEDKSKIKFATEEGDVEEIDWDSLSNEDKRHQKQWYESI